MINGAYLGIGIVNFSIAILVWITYLMIDSIPVGFIFVMVILNYISGVFSFNKAFEEQKGGNHGNNYRKKRH